MHSIAPDYRHHRLNASIIQLHTALADRSDIRRVVPIRDTVLSLGERTFVMGILNATPDSFSDGNKYLSADDAVARAHAMIQEGYAIWGCRPQSIRNGSIRAHIIDIGGQSTKPEAIQVGVEEELRRSGFSSFLSVLTHFALARIIPVIQRLRSAGVTTPISVDTYRAEVAEAAVRAGADLVNDVSGGARDPLMCATVARLGVPIVLMHMRGDERTMMGLKDYDGDVVRTVGYDFPLSVCLFCNAENAIGLSWPRASRRRWRPASGDGISSLTRG